MSPRPSGRIQASTAAPYGNFRLAGSHTRHGVTGPQQRFSTWPRRPSRRPRHPHHLTARRRPSRFRSPAHPLACAPHFLGYHYPPSHTRRPRQKGYTNSRPPPRPRLAPSPRHLRPPLFRPCSHRSPPHLLTRRPALRPPAFIAPHRLCPRSRSHGPRPLSANPLPESSLLLPRASPESHNFANNRRSIPRTTHPFHHGAIRFRVTRPPDPHTLRVVLRRLHDAFPRSIRFHPRSSRMRPCAATIYNSVLFCSPYCRVFQASR